MHNFATITSEQKYGAGYYGKSTLSDMSWIYFNYDIKISKAGDLVVSDVIDTVKPYEDKHGTITKI